MIQLPNSESKNKIRGLNLFLGSTIISGLYCIYTILALPSDPKNSLLLGLSAARLGLVGFVTAGILVSSYLIFVMARNSDRAVQWVRFLWQPGIVRFLSLFSLGLFLCGWAAGFWPPESSGAYTALLERLRPISVWTMYLGITFLATLVVLVRQRPESKIPKIFISVFLISFFLFLITALIIRFTGLGIGVGNHFWNKVGVPFTWFSIALIMGVTLLFHLVSRYKPVTQFGLKHALLYDGLICILLWLASAILWSSTPIHESKFNSGGYPPDYQPYPYSDAAIYDTSAHSMNRGDGMHLSSVDKPLYLWLLSIGNLIAGSEFDKLLIFQILVMAGIPVFLYLIGKELDGRSLGILLAVSGILREYFGIIGTNIIQVTNSKMLMTEVPTTLGILASAYFMIKFMKEPHRLAWAMMAGGIVGLTGLVRLNAILVVPFFILLIGLVTKFRCKQWVYASALVAVMVVVPQIPWMMRNQILYNKPTLSITAKTSGVILEKRYLPVLNSKDINTLPIEGPSPQSGTQTQTPLEVPSQTTTGKSPQYFSLFRDILNHFAHNLATTAMMLPASPWLRNFYQTIRMPYWDINWDGSLLPGGRLVLWAMFLLVSAGLSALWARAGMAALVPFALYLGYLSSTSLSVTSGGRYIQPVDWVLPLYLGAGLILAAATILRLTLSSGTGRVIEIPQSRPKRNSSKLATSILIAVIFLMAGAVIPLNEYLLKNSKINLSSASFNLKGYSHLVQAAGINPNDLELFLKSPQAAAIHGLALYPRLYQQGETEISDPYPLPQRRLIFTLLDKKEDELVVVPMEASANIFKHGGETLVIGCWEENSYIKARAVIQQVGAQNLAIYAPDALAPCPSPD